jgi:hypothetical protein
MFMQCLGLSEMVLASSAAYGWIMDIVTSSEAILGAYVSEFKALRLVFFSGLITDRLQLARHAFRQSGHEDTSPIRRDDTISYFSGFVHTFLCKMAILFNMFSHERCFCLKETYVGGNNGELRLIAGLELVDSENHP